MPNSRLSWVIDAVYELTKPKTKKTTTVNMISNLEERINFTTICTWMINDVMYRLGIDLLLLLLFFLFCLFGIE